MFNLKHQDDNSEQVPCWNALRYTNCKKYTYYIHNEKNKIRFFWQYIFLFFAPLREKHNKKVHLIEIETISKLYRHKKIELFLGLKLCWNVNRGAFTLGYAFFLTSILQDIT